jgi:prepilin peptidase CpaA
VISISALSAFFDLKLRKIPNWLVAIGSILGIVINSTYGLSNFYSSVGGLIVGIAALLLPFALGWIGAGDVKFFGVIGALLGISWLPRVFFYSALVAGLIAGIYVVFGSAQIGMKRLFTELKLAIVSYGRVLPEPIHIRANTSSKSVPWGVAFAIGTIIAYYVDNSGQWAGF